MNFMDAKQKEELLEVFGEAFREVVPPVLEDLKKDLGNKIDDTKHQLIDRIEKVERKLDRITDSHATKLDNHEKRIGKLEAGVAIP